MVKEPVLPKSLREAERQANEVIERIKAGETPDGAANSPEPEARPPVVDTVTETPHLVPPEQNDSGAGDPSPADKITEPSSDPPGETGDNGVWKHKFDTLRGKYDKEIAPIDPDTVAGDSWQERYFILRGLYDAARQAQMRNREYEERIARQDQQLAELSAKIDQLTTSRTESGRSDAEPSISILEQIDPKIREEFGDDLILSMSAVAEKVAEARLAQREPAAADPAPEPAETSAPADPEADRFYADLHRLVKGDVEKVNTDPRFITWLGQVDAGTGVQRKIEFDWAARRGDAITVSQYFNDFISRQESPAPGVAPPPVVPPKVAAGDVPTPKPTFTRADYERFASDVTRGRYKNNPQEMARLEEEFNAALREGRLR